MTIDRLAAIYMNKVAINIKTIAAKMVTQKIMSSAAAKIKTHLLTIKTLSNNKLQAHPKTM